MLTVLFFLQIVNFDHSGNLIALVILVNKNYLFFYIKLIEKLG